jgi:hypothetical protein
MSVRPWPIRFALLVVVSLPGCGLPDLFAPPGMGDVAFTFVGETTLRIGDRSPFSVVVHADGHEISTPRLRILLSQTDSFVAFTPSGDSLVALDRGNAELQVWLESSVLTGTAPNFVQEIRVQQGGGGGGGP